MSSNPLIIGETQKAALRALRDKAALSPVDIHRVMEATKTDAGLKRFRAWMDDYSIPLPTSYYVTFTIETGHPVGTCRHMSMSSMRHGRVPTPEAAWMVAEELGFVVGFSACKVWKEAFSNGAAINIIQPIEISTATGRA